jgi:hypothetical protein
MIAGRPTNLWLGVATAVVSGLTFILLTAGVDPSVVAGVGAALTGLLGAVIALVAYQPPTLTAGDTYTIQTPKGQPNYEATVAPPPQATTPTPEPAA